jgi:hypothetical protein
MLLYGDLTPWYRLVDPPADHADEAEVYADALAGAATPAPETLLELGSGAGHNALYLKKRFRCTLTDRSEPMLALSREINPECEHVPGDMRTMRLGRVFDAVFVHDAVGYMTTGSDLAAAAGTAFVHTRPGGAALFAPDYIRETFRDHALLMQADDDGRALRGVEWVWDPDPSDGTYQVEYALLLRDGGAVRAVHDRHVEGLFSRDTWLAILGGAGFTVAVIERPIGEGCTDRVFLCRRPGSLLPQRGNRIDARGARCRHDARSGTDGGERGSHRHQRRGIGGLHAEEQAAERRRQPDTARAADQQADRDRDQTATHRARHDLTRPSAERDAHADLARALGNRL